VTPILWALNANSSKIAKDTNFKFGMHALRQSPDMTPGKILGKGWGHVTPHLADKDRLLERHWTDSVFV